MLPWMMIISVADVKINSSCWMKELQLIGGIYSLIEYMFQ